MERADGEEASHELPRFGEVKTLKHTRTTGAEREVG
jgi:hypothetical protein